MRSWLVPLCIISLLPLASAQTTVSGNTDFEPALLIPLFIAIIAAIILRKWMVPQQLSSLQVGFEIDDDLYEIHRLTSNRDDAKELLSLPGVKFALALYMMAMTAILLLITELFFNPNVFYLPNVILIGFLFLIPVFISPWESLYIQLSGKKVQGLGKGKIKSLVLRFVTLMVLVSATIATIVYGMMQGVASDMPIWYAVAMLVFMAPTILAYGRIMGASWNMLVIGKWRTIIGRPNPIDPDKVGFVGKFFSIILFLFLMTMPFTAINGIVTVFHVMVNKPDNATDVLNYGGIIGHELYLLVQYHPIFSQIEYLKTLPQVLSVYLSINIAVVGLAFIFELLRNLYLGGQTFGGLGGVMLATPREIRTEEAAQSKVLYFAFAGFSGYTALLLFLVCYKEFGQLMPYIDWLEQRGFKEDVRLLATWMFIAVGQAIFLLTWVLSISRFGHLRRLKFDLNPDERREGAVMSGGSDWMRDTVDQAALSEDIDALIRFQVKDFEEDPALVRHEKARAKMLENALRGLWPKAIEEARKVLAQAGGEDDEARMLIAVGHLASRRLDAAREALHNLQQPEGYDEPELLSFILEWMDPWYGAVDEDDLWDWENNPCIDHLHNMMRMLRDWSPTPSDDSIHHDALTQCAMLSQVGLLRAQNQHEDAIELALKTVKNNPLGARPRIAVALCLLDSGDWHSALSILSELEISDEYDPRVKALANIMGKEVSSDQLEVALTRPPHKRSKNLINEAPVNPVAGLMVKGGVDEALTANIMIAASESVAMKMTPIYTTGIISFVVNWLLLTPTWVLIGIAATTELGTFQGAAIGGALIFFHHGYRRLRKQQRRVIKHRDQKAMVAYAKRLKRHKVELKQTDLPVGTHLLLSGLLVTVNGVVFDVGFPGWLVTRLPKSSEKGLKQRFARRYNSSKRAKDARKQNLSNGWWLKRPKEAGADVAALERLIGPVAYRGRSQMVQRKTGRLLRSHSQRSGRQPMSEVSGKTRQIPMNTIRSERSGSQTGQKNPSGPPRRAKR